MIKLAGIKAEQGWPQLDFKPIDSAPAFDDRRHPFARADGNFGMNASRRDGKAAVIKMLAGIVCERVPHAEAARIISTRSSRLRLAPLHIPAG